MAAEAALTARVHGAGVDEIHDVGVAGLHRLLGVRDQLDKPTAWSSWPAWRARCRRSSAAWSACRWWRCPTSVGYGASFGGLAALLAMLNSCAPGVTVVNIDNGYGAGVFAARVARGSGRQEP